LTKFKSKLRGILRDIKLSFSECCLHSNLSSKFSSQNIRQFHIFISLSQPLQRMILCFCFFPHSLHAN
jgi:hypothetical protein